MSFLKMENVSFAYPRGEAQVVKNVSFSIDEHETVALMGPNGSGKTTIGKLLVKIYKPTKGRVMLEGSDISDFSLGEVGSRVGYVFQNPIKQIFSPTVEEEVGFGLRFRGEDDRKVNKKVAEMLAYFDLSHKAKAFPFNLSMGEKQRLVIAAVLALEPKFIIFDEPTTGLDSLRKKKFFDMLKRIRDKGAGYMIISHDEGFCKECTEKMLYLKDGMII
jgi:energy-coupling factor transport system ATP-binding protein